MEFDIDQKLNIDDDNAFLHTDEECMEIQGVYSKPPTRRSKVEKIFAHELTTVSPTTLIWLLKQIPVYIDMQDRRRIKSKLASLNTFDLRQLYDIVIQRLHELDYYCTINGGRDEEMIRFNDNIDDAFIGKK